MSEELDHTLSVAGGVSFGLGLVIEALREYKEQRMLQRKSKEKAA